MKSLDFWFATSLTWFLFVLAVFVWVAVAD